MQKKKILGAILGTFFTALTAAPPANATLITTGYIEVRSPYMGGFTFDFMIGGLSAHGWSDEGSKYFRPSLYEGETFNGNQDNRAPNDLFGGYVEDEGVEWRNAWEPFPTRFDTRAEGSVLTAGQTVYTSSFEFSGQLCGRKGWETSECFIAFPNLTGQGIAQFFFDESILEDGRHLFTPTKALYTFAPVPEPATLALFSIGFAGIALSRRRRSARHC